jgi:ATP-dependent helicase YprA (DUF1998 family)
VEAITEDGAPSGRKEFLLWGCPISSNVDPIGESTRLMSFLMKRGVRVILFCRVNIEFSFCFVSLVGVDVFLDQKILRTGQI